MKVIDERDYLKTYGLTACFCSQCKGMRQHRPSDEELQQQMESDAQAMEEMARQAESFNK